MSIDPRLGEIGRPLRTIEIHPPELPVPDERPEHEPDHEREFEPDSPPGS